jgi:putative redox protein
MDSHGPTMRVRHLGDAQFVVSTREHELILDRPFESAGGNSGPTPTELFVASLAACIASYGSGFLRARGLPDRVDVDARWSMALSPARVGRVQIAINAFEVPSEELDDFRRAVENCTVQNTLFKPPAVSLEVAIDSNAEGRSEESPG